MYEIVDIAQMVLDVQIPGFQDFWSWIEQLFGQFNTGTPLWDDCIAQNADCPSSAYHAITAAFATQGYWIQSDILYYLQETGMQLWAPLLYILSAMAGMISMTLGQPPRNYVWYFMGPALFHWLIGTTVDVHGVAWKVAGKGQDQEQVWKLAEPGLRNNSGIIRMGAQVSSTQPPTERARVAYLFAWFDGLISDQIQWFGKWAGVDRLWPNQNAGTTTNLCASNAGSNTMDGQTWHILSDFKWEILSNITGAKTNTIPLRDAFIQFMISECGDILKRNVDDEKYISAATSNGETVRDLVTIFKGATGPNNYNYNNFVIELSREYIPVPRALTRLVQDQGVGSFGDFSRTGYLSQGFMQKLPFGRMISCDGYLWLLIHGLRWEAGHIYYHAFSRADQGSRRLNINDVVYSFLYGWDVKKNCPAGLPGCGQCLDLSEQQYFLRDLILLHLIRNELALAPKPVNVRYAQSVQDVKNVESYQRVLGSKNKFGELYTWAKLVPYLQGVLLYFLALAYPFACVLIVVPGWHKTVLTWMSFWAWAKLWDLGFALVGGVERTVWGIIGNSADASSYMTKVVEMQRYGRVGVACQAGNIGSILPGNSLDCAVPYVQSLPGSAAINGIGSVGTDLGTTGLVNMEGAIRILDQAMIVSASLDLDLANSYYVFIMAALYFAVPAVTGQLVLGARAGAAGMVNSSLGGVSGEAGKAAGSGATGDLAQRLKAAETNLQQGAAAKHLRKSGAQHRASGSAIGAFQQGLAKDYMGQMQGIEGLKASGIDMNLSNLKSGFDTAGAVVDQTRRGFGSRSAPGTGSSSPGASGAGAGQSGGQAGAQSGGSAPSGSGAIASLGAWLGNKGKGIMSVGGPAVSAGLSIGQNLANVSANNASWGHRTAAQQAGIGATMQGMAAQQSQMAAQRYATEADYGAQNAMYEATAGWAQDLASGSSALGILPGSIAPTPLPNNREGFQSAGMLDYGKGGAFNTSASRQWAYPKRGGQASREIMGFGSRMQGALGDASGVYVHRPSASSTVGDAFATADQAVAGGAGKGLWDSITK